MATISSLEDNLAPKEFHLSTSTIDSDSRLSPCKQRCPLCRKFRQVFHCTECVHNGLFYSFKHMFPEGYLDKKRTFLLLDDSKKTLEKNCLELLETKRKSNVLKFKIKQAKDSTKILQSVLEEKILKRSSNNRKLATLKDKNNERNKHLPLYETKVQEQEISVSYEREKVVKYKELTKKKQAELKRLVKLRIQQLFKYIFPITPVTPIMETNISTDDMVNALAEASRWEYSDYLGEMRYCIVGPTLPGSGNYSSYNTWVVQNQDAVPGSNIGESVEPNPAFSIGAALTYTAQLISILSFYLNIKLPYKMQYSDFCNGFMNDQQFARRTARLNANILYLCFLQNVNLTTLNSVKTIHNILQLIEDPHGDLGREGPSEYNMLQAVSLEQKIKSDLKTSEESDSEAGDSFPVEWEAVPHVQCPEIAAGPATSQSPQMSSTQQASSLAGGFMNSAAASIASIWRGFTHR